MNADIFLTLQNTTLLINNSLRYVIVFLYPQNYAVVFLVKISSELLPFSKVKLTCTL
jgi:hypothetical protein